MPATIPADLIHLAVAAKILGVSRQSVLRWVIVGRMKGYRIGHRWRVSRADVQAAIQEWTVADANNRIIAEEAARPAMKKELADREKKADRVLRENGVR